MKSRIDYRRIISFYPKKQFIEVFERDYHEPWWVRWERGTDRWVADELKRNSLSGRSAPRK